MVDQGIKTHVGKEITVQRSEKWVKQNQPDTRHKISVAAHYNHHTAFCFPAPLPQGREQDAAQ